MSGRIKVKIILIDTNNQNEWDLIEWQQIDLNVDQVTDFQLFLSKGKSN